jgi:hypothetical protein
VFAVPVVATLHPKGVAEDESGGQTNMEGAVVVPCADLLKCDEADFRTARRSM